jgi:Na+/melibiose symporter-like transporter
MERAAFWRESERTGKLPLKTKIIYALGEMPGSHMNSAIGTLLALYYNQILGVPASIIAIAMGLALFLDSVSDPVVGTYSDNLKSILGRRHPLMYAAALPLGIFMALLFSPPAGLGEEALVAWLTTFLILARLTFTLFSVPWSAMTSELSDSYSERSVVVSWRQIVGHSLGALYGYLIFTFVFSESDAFPQGQLNPENYALFAPLLGTLITTWCLITTHFTRDQIQYSYQRTDSQSFGLLVLLTSLRSALTNRNFALLLCGSLIAFGVFGVLGFFDMYVNTYFWELKAKDFGIIALFVWIGPLIAVLLVMNFQAHFEKHHGLVLRTILAKAYSTARNGLPDNEDMGCHSAFYMCGMLGLYPVMGQDWYFLTAPAFTSSTITLGESGATFVIRAPEASPEHLYISAATLNGKPIDRAWVYHREIDKGGELTLDLCTAPTSWGTKRQPPSPMG